MTISNTSELNQKLEDLKKIDLEKAIKSCCEIIRSTVLEDMAKTQRNMNVSYVSGKNRSVVHHPSLPGNAPAPDTGNLRASIHYTVDKSDEQIIGRVGTNVEYGQMLEYGTSTILPRPWLEPALQKNNEVIKNIISEVIK